MEEEFMNEDVKRVMSKLMMRMQESEDSPPFNSDLSVVERNAGSSEQLSPSKQKSIKPKEFAEVTLARMNGIKQKSMDNLKKIAETKDQKEVAELRVKPLINSHSRKIGKRNEPVHERVQKEIEEAKKSLERVKEKLEAERNSKIIGDLTFKPKTNKPTTVKRSSEDFFKYNMNWIEKKNLKTENKRQEIEGKINVELKFTPEIDNNSISIVDALGVKKPIEERLLEKMEYNKKKKQAMRDEQPFSFAPVIEENSRLIAKHKIEGNVFDRLFYLSKEQDVPMRSPKFAMNRSKSFSFSNDLEEDPQKKLDLLFDLA